MDSGELIELFYNRTYEKFVNKQILDDKNYIVPRQQLTNYVHELINIPYIEFIEYLKKQKAIIVKGEDVTHFSSFSTCEINMCNALIWANNPGCTFVEIGRLFPDNVSSRNDIAYRLYGEKHIKAATQLGLTFEYYDYWYLSCIGYIYPDLNEEERTHLLARTITRNNLYQQMLVDIMDHDVYPELYLTMFSGGALKSRIKNIVAFFDICIEECELNNISTHRLYRRNANIDSSDSLDVLSSSKTRSIYRLYRSYKLLSDEEMIILFQRYERGDTDAFDTLVKSYLRLVLSIAKLYEGKGLEYDDLIQEGTLGLIKAIEKYDYIQGASFGFYARTWIKQSIIQAINTQSLTVQIPLNQLAFYKKVRKEIEKYEQKNGFNPSVTEIEIGEDIELKKLSYLESLPDDLHELVLRKDNWEDYPSIDFPADDLVMTESKIHFVNSIIRKLNKRESEIIRCTFGIGVKIESLTEIGERMYLTRERVRQIKEKAIKKLREIVNQSNNDVRNGRKDNEAEEIESTIGEIERKNHINRMLKRAEKSQKNSSDNPQKGQFRIVNNEETFEIRGVKDGIIVENPQYLSSDDNKVESFIHKGFKEVSVGDKIMYNSKPCVVLDKSVKYNFIRLKVQYDDGRIDNVIGEKSRYEIVNYRDNDYKQELSTHTSKKKEIEEIDTPNHNEVTISKRKSREELYSYYTQLISRLKQATAHGKKILAKPALLVAIIDAIGKNQIQQNKVVITTNLEDRYNAILANYSGKSPFDRLTSIAMPFWFLQYDKFWFMEPHYYSKAKYLGPSKKWLIDNIKYARLDDDLWYLLQDEAWRNKLRIFIIKQKLLDESTSQDNSAHRDKSERGLKSEGIRQPKFLITTSLNDLVRLGIITNKQLKHCNKKGLRTIGDVKKKIEYYHLTPDSTRFTKYTLDMWFGIVGLLNNNL